jgi:hypothetical protein
VGHVLFFLFSPSESQKVHCLFVTNPNQNLLSFSTLFVKGYEEQQQHFAAREQQTCFLYVSGL